jgi:2-polyprenyl-3-methyl-5-hydroxy-6-metoxy-1,4-benzoquinol methylase
VANFDAKKAFYKSSSIGSKERIYSNFVHVFISKLYSDEYIKYLKSKTKMNFKNVLDIGAKYGTFVKSFEEIGIDAIGIESDQNCVQLATTKKIKWGFFDENYQTTQKYDLICLPQVIYYFPDTYLILNHVKKMLNPNGLIFVSTYNTDSNFFKTNIKDITNTCNMLLSREEYSSLNEKMGLELLDYTTYVSNVSLDFAFNKNSKSSFLKYRLGLRKGLIPDPDGFIAFILLKNS